VIDADREVSRNEVVWNQADGDGYGEREGAEGERYCPLRAVEAGCGQDAATEEDDEELAEDGDEADAGVVVVSVEAFEDVEVVVEAAVAVKVFRLVVRGGVRRKRRRSKIYLYWLKNCIQTYVLNTSVSSVSSSWPV